MKYLVFYDTVDNQIENRNYVLSSSNKLSYIFDVIKKNAIDFEVVSASGAMGKRPLLAKTSHLENGAPLILPASLGRSCRIIRVVDRAFIKLQLFFRLLKMKEGETLVVYHSLFYMNLVKLIKKFKKVKLVLEVEEIYGDVMENDRVSKKELDFCKLADAYIFPTELLDEKINKNKKPSVIIHGTYKVEANLAQKFDDGKIHIVYAGTLDPRKGGAAAAVAAGEFLDENYHIHILGFGNDKDKINLLTEIERASKTSDCKVTYDGLLSGQEYLKFLQSCHIGLSTQNPAAAFNDTSFPSKILSYMANGLRVVSIRIAVIETSSINDYMSYYDEQTPESIAEAIKSIIISDTTDFQKVVSDLDKKFVSNIRKMLGE